MLSCSLSHGLPFTFESGFFDWDLRHQLVIAIFLCRLNLEDGRFYESLASKSPGINKLAVSPVHGLVGAAGEEGLLECFDLRQEQCAGRFDAASAMGCVSLLLHGPACHLCL